MGYFWCDKIFLGQMTILLAVELHMSSLPFLARPIENGICMCRQSFHSKRQMSFASPKSTPNLALTNSTLAACIGHQRIFNDKSMSSLSAYALIAYALFVHAGAYAQRKGGEGRIFVGSPQRSCGGGE